jgi:hypothetical protein
VSNELTEYNQSSSPLIPVTRQDVDAMKKQRELLREFISSQMKEANFKNSSAEDYGEGDYGVIPGTKKRTLLKPGAEKLLRLFGLGARVRLADKEIDREANLAVFIYRAEVYHLRSSVVIAECEGSANSQEVKYRERTVWRKKKLANGKEVSESIKEETPVYDVLNTLMKMSQKRALIGATIIATAASDYFTQDMEPDEDPPATQAREAAAKSAEKAEEKTTAAPPEAATDGAVPVCCDKEMMVSKYPDRETGEYPYFCMKCRKKVPSGILER